MVCDQLQCRLAVRTSASGLWGSVFESHMSLHDLPVLAWVFSRCSGSSKHVESNEDFELFINMILNARVFVLCDWLATRLSHKLSWDRLQLTWSEKHYEWMDWNKYMRKISKSGRMNYSYLQRGFHNLFLLKSNTMGTITWTSYWRDASLEAFWYACGWKQHITLEKEIKYSDCLRCISWYCKHIKFEHVKKISFDFQYLPTKSFILIGYLQFRSYVTSWYQKLKLSTCHVTVFRLL